LHIGGFRALLAQLSHPWVAQGVYDHSRFLQDPVGRALRTFETVYRIVFGDRDSAIEWAARTHKAHSFVKGVIRDPDSPFFGQPYSANDLDPLYWVFMTLLEASVFVYERYVEPLSPGEKDRLLEEGEIFCALFGIPFGYTHKKYNLFAQEYHQRLKEEKHRFTREGKILAYALLSPPWGKFLKPIHLTLIAGTVPEPILNHLAIQKNLSLTVSYEMFVRTLHLFYHRLPPFLRYIPHARKAYRSIPSNSS
jgi:uncharacterized protein (DUF2236 family)